MLSVRTNAVLMLMLGCVLCAPARGQICNPPAPSNVSATNGTRCDAVRITWSAVSSALSYRVYRGLSSNAALMVLIGSSTSTSFLDTGALPNQVYHYRVRTVRVCGPGPYSGSNSGWREGLPDEPTGTSAEGVPCGIYLSWESVPTATEYHVRVSRFDSLATAFASFTVTTTEVINTDPEPGEQLYYWVRAKNACGPGPFTPSFTAVRLQPLVFTSHPQSQSVHEGGAATLQVTVGAGAGPLVMGWEKDGAGVSPAPHRSGVNGPVLGIDPVGSSDAGVYRALMIDAGGRCGVVQSNLAMLTVVCYADCNADGQTNLADFGCFQTKFALNNPYADCNGDGSLNLADFGCYQTKFALGCP